MVESESESKHLGWAEANEEIQRLKEEITRQRNVIQGLQKQAQEIVTKF